MKKLEYTLCFTTPAFLGNAEQSGQWRTPPFKALLRQWWRVAYAADRGFKVNIADMRREEGLLFGNAWLENQFCKSLVRIRLDSWKEGQLKSSRWQSLATVTHPEVTKAIGSDLYLGYGPITLPHGVPKPTLKAKAAIQAGENSELSLAIPAKHGNAEIERLLEANAPRIERALWLLDRYGTLGGRSRNGWGSISLLPLNADSQFGVDLGCFARPWVNALEMDWPHAIGADDEKPLIWQTAKAYDDWKNVMRDLAIIKIGLRTQFVFNTGNNASAPEARHWLSHPVTKHNVRAWKQGRLPNSLRFKVRPDVADPGKLRGVIFHVPCLPPPGFRPDRPAIERTWRQVHALLDHLGARPGRDYSMISDLGRRNELKSQLDTVTLERIPQ